MATKRKPKPPKIEKCVCGDSPLQTETESEDVRFVCRSCHRIVQGQTLTEARKMWRAAMRAFKRSPKRGNRLH